jgi:hypothetical protein
MTTTNIGATAAADAATQRLYQAELALEDARGSGIDEWVRAAADRLHEAVLCHRLAHPDLAVTAQPHAA